jgi:macrolide transport system ATP-binding/permease protein
MAARKDRNPNDNPFDIRNMAEIQEALGSTSKIMSVLLASIAGISLIVGGIGIMNIMLVSVTERTREIGLRKAIGARRQDILAQFLIEALAISLLGGLAGLALGIGLSLGLAKGAGWPMEISSLSAVVAFSFSVFIGIFFGLWPAMKASKLNPIEALRYE